MTAAAPFFCRACGEDDFRDVYETSGVPVHSCVLFDDPGDAATFPRGDIRLVLCRRCGLIQNRAFDEAAVHYSSDYEDSQAHSPHFLSFAADLIDRLDATYGIAGKRVLEIGCGKGDFLILLANRLGMTGVGIDPAYRPGPLVADDPSKVRFVAESFSEEYDLGPTDLIVCRHTLEHVAHPKSFLSAIRKAIGDRRDTIVFFEVPDSRRILSERAFWDIYFEHCSYFVDGSIRNLVEACGFEVLETWLGMADQYLMLVARPGVVQTSPSNSFIGGLEAHAADFQTEVAGVVTQLRQELDASLDAGGTVVLWGASSKVVAYLHSLDASSDVAGVVDINPVKQGKFLAGTGLPILSPDDLSELGPDTVIAMNPVYRDEIQADLEARGVTAKVAAVPAVSKSVPVPEPK